MDVRLATPSSSTSDVDMSEFLSLTNASPTPPLMHTLQPLMANGTATEADFSMISNDLETMSAVDISKPGSYDMLSSSRVTEAYSTSSGQGFLTIHPSPGRAVEISTSSASSVDLPSDRPQYYIQCQSETGLKLDSEQECRSNVGQMNLSAVASLPSQLPAPSSSPHLPTDLLTLPNNFVLPASQTFGNLRPAGVIDVSTPPKKPLSPYMRFSKGVRNC